MVDDQVQAERERRFKMWGALKEMGGPRGVSPSSVRQAGVYGGAQGIFRDLEKTAPLSPDGTGVTVSVLHTGSSYADDLTGDGVIYHYPVTNRPGQRDHNKVSATKLCGELGLPVFVVETPESTPTVRDVHIGWVAEHDDVSGQLLILFGDDPKPFGGSGQDDEDTRFVLKAKRRQHSAQAKTRPDQARFRFAVLRRYGTTCALCRIQTSDLLQAAHICPVTEGGSDDPRNGLVLCLNHLGLIRFGGHLPKGEYDVDHGGHEGQAGAAELHG